MEQGRDRKGYPGSPLSPGMAYSQFPESPAPTSQGQLCRPSVRATAQGQQTANPGTCEPCPVSPQLT